MRTVALLMAGGRGERMRASGEARPKPLVPVAGATLLERSLWALLRDGFGAEIVVSVPHEVPAIGAHAASRGRDLVEAAGGRLTVLDERVPMGNLGCASALDGEADEVLVVYADNLTTLDLGAVLAQHRHSGADFTLAAHHHVWRMPVGELVIDGASVVDYREKPQWEAVVSSAVSVLSPTALSVLGDLVGSTGSVGMVDLFHALHRREAPVSPYLHAAPWVDVNDVASLPAAEALVAADPNRCDRWWLEDLPQVDATVAVDVRRISRPDPGRPPIVVLDDLLDGAPVRFVVSGGSSLEAARAPLPASVEARAAFHLGRLR